MVNSLLCALWPSASAFSCIVTPLLTISCLHLRKALLFKRQYPLSQAGLALGGGGGVGVWGVEMGGWMRSPLKCQPLSPKSQLCLITWHFLWKRVRNITLGRNSKMIKKDVEPESIIILIKSLSSSLIPPISKYHCRMPVPCFEIQIAQLPLNFIFNTTPPAPKKIQQNKFSPSVKVYFHGKHAHRKFKGSGWLRLWVKFSTMW